jgi:hypothetical protein
VGAKGKVNAEQLSVLHALADTSLMPSRLTVAVRILDIEKEWTLNALLTTSSSYRKCSKRRTLDHSVQATSLLQIEGTIRCSRRARGFGCGSVMASVAALSLQCSD